MIECVPTPSVGAIPDRPPTIAFAGPPESNARGTFNLAYRARDDYGVVAKAFRSPCPGREFRTADDVADVRRERERLHRLRLFQDTAGHGIMVPDERGE